MSIVSTCGFGSIDSSLSNTRSMVAFLKRSCKMQNNYFEYIFKGLFNLDLIHFYIYLSICTLVPCIGKVHKRNRTLKNIIFK